MADWVPRPVSHSVYLFGWSGEFRRAEEIASLLGVQPPDRRWFAGGWKLLETWRDAPADSSQLQGAVDELVHRVVSIGPRLQQLTESGRLSSTFSVSSYIDRDALKVWDGYGTELVPDRGPEDLIRLKDPWALTRRTDGRSALISLRLLPNLA